MRLKLSPGNSKMGAIPSVSLPAEQTCPAAPCIVNCYGRKIERLRPAVHAAYQNNLDLLRSDPDTYWREAEGGVMVSRFFRFHVSGDIPDSGYLARMVELAVRQPHCQILCFTKRYGLVNEYLGSGRTITDNLHLIFSAWRGYPMDNPYRLPEAHVLYRDGTTTAAESAEPCGGNCTNCAKVSGGCWGLKRGEQVVFKQH